MACHIASKSVFLKVNFVPLDGDCLDFYIFIITHHAFSITFWMPDSALGVLKNKMTGFLFMEQMWNKKL